MLKKTIKTSLALIIGGVFLWLAFRNVRLAEVWNYAKTISFWWLLPFGATVFLSNVVRAERWRLLIEHEKEDLSSITLIAGVLTGYLMNLVGPRFGEVSRPVYVAKREGLSSSKLIGTIVLERLFDLATMILLMVVVAIYLISDLNLLRQIFGDQTIDFITHGLPFNTAVWVIGAVILILLLGYAAIKILKAISKRVEKVHDWVEKVKDGLRQFKDGLMAARKVDRWWLFLLYTVLLWTCYTLMSYIPFYMFDATSHLGILEALTITVVSAIGIAIPSPGGIGTYHYFVKQTLKVLFGISLAAGLTYATITHAATILMVTLFTPFILGIDKWRQSQKGSAPI